MRNEPIEENKVEIPNGATSIIEVEANGKIYSCYLRDLNKSEIGYFLNKIRNNPDFDIIELGEQILRKTFISGDNEILLNEKMLISASIQASNTIEIYNSTLKKI